MTDIRFTKHTVEQVAGAAKKVTDGGFQMSGPGEDVGNGVRYYDAHTDKIWFGPEGAREACAYYIGGTLGWLEAQEKQLPDDLLWLRDVQDAYGPDQRYRNWEIEGRYRAGREMERRA